MGSTWVKANIADRWRPLTTQVGSLALFHGMPVTVQATVIKTASARCRGGFCLFRARSFQDRAQA
jgi:hypothetical protein